MNRIFLHTADRPHKLSKASIIKSLIVDLFKNEKVNLFRVDYIFCSDDYLLKMNRNHLNHNTLTDIITFPLSNSTEAVKGEIYISIDRIKENANTYKVSYQNEILRVMIHGALHLCGFNDKTKAQQVEMRQKENYYLKKNNVSREANAP